MPSPPLLATAAAALTYAGFARNAGGGSGLGGVASLIVTEEHLFAAVKTTIRSWSSSGARTGLLTFVQQLINGRDQIAGLDNPVGLAISPDGKWLYVASAGEGEDRPGGVAWFGIHEDALPAAPLVVSYTNINDLSVRTGTGNDRVSLRGVGEGVESVSVDTGDGDDRVLVQQSPENVTATCKLGGGADEMDLRATGEGATTPIYGEADNDTILVWSTGENSTTTIEGGDGEDEFRVAGDALGAGITVRGGDPAAVPGDALLFDTAGKTVTTTGTVPGDGSITVEGRSHGVEFYSIEQLDQFTPLTASAGVPYTINEGDGLTLDGSGSDPGLVEWDIDGDGQFGDVNGSQPQLEWSDLEGFGLNDDGQYQVAVRVTASGGFNIAMTTVTIVNVPPTLSIERRVAAR